LTHFKASFEAHVEQSQEAAIAIARCVGAQVVFGSFLANSIEKWCGILTMFGQLLETVLERFTSEVVVISEITGILQSRCVHLVIHWKRHV
jgi:hypothetical protein